MESLRKRINLIKTCAVFTTVCFIMSTMGANLYAIPMSENVNKKYEDVFNKASSISNEYGKITSSKDAKSDITVINIQDLHCHPQTQRNISKIIGQIADKYNLKKVYVEGGYGDIDVSWLNQIKDENIRRQIIEKLMEEGILTGSEYYKLTSNNEKVELKGIDEEKLHKENIKRLSWIIENQGKYKETISKIDKEIKFLEQSYVNVRNKRFNTSIEDYMLGKIDSKRFYRQLIKYVKDINENPESYNNITAIRLEDYPNISKFMTLRKVSKDINVREVTQQLQIVINELKNRLPYNVYTQLLKETENLSDSQKVVELITLLCNKEGIDLDNKYKSLKSFLESNEINRELNAVELVYEERQLITEIRKALSYNNEEYEITFVSDFSRYFQDYLEYKLTDADWKYFETGYYQFRELYSKYATVDRIEEIEQDFDEINKYYDINDQRNNIFVENLLKDEQINFITNNKVRQDEEILKQSKEVIIAVTGGFHSSELEEILQAKDVNTIVITPSIFEGIEKATKQYKGIIKEQSKEFQHQALSYTLASCTTDENQQRLLYLAALKLVGNDVEKLRNVLGDNVNLTVLKEIQSSQISEEEEKQISIITKCLESVADIVVNLLPTEGYKTIFYPNMGEFILEISERLVEAGIFFSNGVIIDIEEYNLPDLHGIPAEIYSRMHSVIQEALLKFTSLPSSEELRVPKIKKKRRFRNNGRHLNTRYYATKSNEKAEQVLTNLVQNNEYSYAKILDIVKKYNLDIEKDIQLLNILATNIYFNDDILDRIINAVKKHNIDTDFKYEILLRYGISFEDAKSIDSLFSLSDENLEFLSNIYTYENALELEVLLGLDNLNERLNNFRTIYIDKFGLDVLLLDVSVFTVLIEQIDKIQNLSKESFEELVSLQYYGISYILKNVSNSYEIEKIFEYAHKFNLSSKIVKATRNNIDEDFKDIRYKAIIKFFINQKFQS